MEYLFTSECVTKGHPDKICDQISDAILDACLTEDPDSRVACETLVTTGQVVVAGEITTKTYVEVQDVVRKVIKDIGYTKGELLFSAESCGILNAIHSQSPDISQGVDVGGAGDQGMMFGGACTETPELMPLPISIARAITNKYTELRDDGRLIWGRPDGKAQVTVKYDSKGSPIGIDTIVMSVQHDPSIERDEIQQQLELYVIGPILKPYGFSIEDVRKIYVNPTGKFIIGGPHGDSGLTGRKIIVDTYGGYFSHGGGAFSGKDPTKVDRSAAYAARWVAKNIVAAGLATKVEVQLSYAIGVIEPTSINIKCFGTAKVDKNILIDAVTTVFDLTPLGIIKALGLKQPSFKYQDLAASGHLGRTDIDLPWERLDKVEELKTYFLL
ncbi:methionine adenosyltransferase [Clostridium tagluense]|nr:methionine adenosyltransferase [Clostridium tagluense]MCB2314116.1 methionine adenosyltransferase [Clostridium tagluense]MCB2318825.1 methionine adenosyltransferase [Clostridium tagluense]MCB2323835.1 methionine adenosyltransferase [Clostridium tagluense]MCB2328674.1 methionine adenosyltransferase [Clostridium tagluense]MCB2333558.1 methionine adenosyltransferase [Clostridium tagluense]